MDMVESFYFSSDWKVSRCGVTANMPALGAGDSGFESLHLDTAFWARYGDYGVTVNTRVCGSRNSGSIPDSHPTIQEPRKGFLY